MNEPPKLPQVWVLYGAMVLAQFLMVGVFTGVLERGASPDPTVLMVFPVMAMSGAFASVTAGRLWGATLKGITPHILRWAFGESVTIFGCMAWFMGASALIAAPLMAFGTLLVLFQPPIGE